MRNIRLSSKQHKNIMQMISDMDKTISEKKVEWITDAVRWMWVNNVPEYGARTIVSHLVNVGLN